MAISFISAASANANNVNITTPQKGDLIIVFSWNNASTTIPTLAAGYTSIITNTTTGTAGRAAYKISDGTETNSDTWTNATNVSASIRRGVFKPGTSASSVGNSSTLSYPTISPQSASGNSWVVGGAIAKSATAGMNGTTAALDSNRTNQTTINDLDTGNGVSSFAAQTLSVTGSGRWITFSIELIAFDQPSDTLTQLDAVDTQLQPAFLIPEQLTQVDAFFYVWAKNPTAGGDDRVSIGDNLALGQNDAFSFVLTPVQLNLTLNDAGVIFSAAPLWMRDGLVSNFQQLDLRDDTGVYVEDNFDGPNADNLGGNWLAPKAAFTVVNGLLRGNVVEVPIEAYQLSVDMLQLYVGRDFPSNQFAQVRYLQFLAITNGGFEFVGVHLQRTSATTGYVLTPFGSSEASREWQLRRLDADSITWSNTTNGVHPKVNDVAAVTYVNGIVRAYVNGVLILTHDDSSSPVPGGNPGLGVTRGYGPIFEEFKCGATDGSLLDTPISISDPLNAAFLRISDSDFGDNWQDSVNIAIGLPTAFSDSIQNEVDTLFYVWAKNPVSGQPDKASIGDNLVLKLADDYSQVLTSGSGDLTQTFSDQLVFSDSDIVQELGGSFVFELLDVLGIITIATGTAGSEQLTQTDSELNVLGLLESFSDQLVLSDSLAVGYGNGIFEQIVFSDSNLLGYGDLISDQLVLSESLVIGYGQGTVDSLTFTDKASVGYGDQISDTLSLSDSEANILGIVEILSDQLVFSDSIASGYGNAISEQIVLSDSETIGYGQGTVDSLTFSDASSIGYGDLISDQLVLTDSLASLFSIAGSFSDTLTLSDSEIIGYGNATVDSLTFLDASSVGYGDVISDSLTLSDSEINVFGLLKTFSDQLVLSDALASLLSIAETLSDQLVLTDSLLVGYGNSVSDQLVFSDTTSLLFSVNSIFSETLTITDSNALGYGFLIADSFILSDSFADVLSIAESFSDTLLLSDSNAVGYGNVVSDALSLSDSEIIGYGQGTVDSLTFSDANAIGYGDLISDSFTLTDSIFINSGDSLISESFSDTLTLLDSLAVGYGQANVDSLTFTDSSSVGFGDVISDILAQSDSEVNVLGMLKAFSEQLVQTDNEVNLLRQLVSFSDTLVQTDSLIVGYGQAQVDSLIFTDSSSVGYGDVISDTLALSDSEVALLGMIKTFSDQIVLSDSFTDLLAGAEVFADTLILSDSEIIGYGNQMVESLLFLESQTIGYGNLIADSINNWLDQFQFSTGQPAIQLSFSDSIALSDRLGAGYGQQVSEQVSMTDSAGFMESMLILLADATPTMLEAFDALLAYSLSVDDAIVFQEQLVTLYGLLIGDSEFLTDQLDSNLITALELAVQDSESVAWFENVVAESVFAPGEVVIRSMGVLAQMSGQISVEPSIGASSAQTTGKAVVSRIETL